MGDLEDFGMIKRGGQILLGLFFLVAGVMHFTEADAFAGIVPPVLPFPYIIVWMTGLMEIGFALALFAKFHLPKTGILLGLFLLAVLPANFYMALYDIPMGDTRLSPIAAWVRIAAQFPLIAFVLWCCGSPPFRGRP